MTITVNSLPEIVFVRTSHHYDTYDDLFRLAELSGFPVITLPEVNVSEEKIYILSPINGEWKPHIEAQDNQTRNAYLILWDLERPSSRGGLGSFGRINRKLLYERYFDEVWVGDPRLADETNLRYVPVGSHYDFGAVGTNKVYTFCHMSYIIPRRETIYSQFVNLAPNAWGERRHIFLQQSKFALTMHQDALPFQEPLRLAIYAAYGLPIISESVYNDYPYNGLVITADYDDLVDKIRECLRGDYNEYREIGMRIRDRMCTQFQFGKVVREAVRDSLQWR